MHHHINHCWCSTNHLDGKLYDAPNMVDIDKDEGDAEDWDRLIDVRMIVSKGDLKEQRNVARRLSEKYSDVSFTEDEIIQMAERSCPFLKPEIIEWLDTNIKPQKNGQPGWSMGNDQYRVRTSSSLVLWFQRRNDAKKFIRTWSSFKKATSYFNYFDNPITNLVLDTNTMKYHNRHEKKWLLI